MAKKQEVIKLQGALESCLPPTPDPTGVFGKILIIGGLHGNDYTDDGIILDLEKKTTCKISHPYPGAYYGEGGGLVTTDLGPMPLLCGGNNGHPRTDKCHVLGSGGWTEVSTLTQNSLPHWRYGMSAVTVDSQWIMFSGGTQRGVTDETFLLNGSGRRVELPALSLAREYPCSAILHEDQDQVVVAVMGGAHGSGFQKTMDRYSCTKGVTPTCNKISNGPDMVDARYAFGCGTLQTSEGAGKVLLAMNNGQGRTNVLDLGNNGQGDDGTWTRLPVSMDVPSIDKGSAFSFVTSSDDPSTGYLLPVQERTYVYKVQCQNAQTCNFDKIETGYTNPFAPVTMAIQSTAHLDCN